MQRCEAIVSKHAQLDRSLKQRLARLLSAALSESEITQNPAVSLILSRSDAGALRKYCDGEPTPKKIKDLPKLIAATEIKNAFPRKSWQAIQEMVQWRLEIPGGERSLAESCRRNKEIISGAIQAKKAMRGFSHKKLMRGLELAANQDRETRLSEKRKEAARLTTPIRSP
jgi:hypothetical protein